MRTTIILTVASTLLAFAVATPAGTLSEPNTNAILPIGEGSALQGCFERCGNSAQCGDACGHCSNGRCHSWKRADVEVATAPVSLARKEAIVYQGCFEKCGNDAQCTGVCNYCSKGRCNTWKSDEVQVAAAPVSLPREEAIAYQGCFEQCGNDAQCTGVCNYCSNGRCHTRAKRDEPLSE